MTEAVRICRAGDVKTAHGQTVRSTPDSTMTLLTASRVARNDQTGKS